MCPSVPAPLPFSVDACYSDEEVILFLERRRVGDPFPSNVIVEESPFNVEPWDSPEGMWYLYNSEDLKSHCKGSIIETTRNGYWRSVDCLRIATCTPVVGRKTMREFYIGQAPSGDRSGWMMHEYQAEEKVCQGKNVPQGSSCLCRVFLRNDEKASHGGRNDSVTLEEADGEYLESMLESLLEEEGDSSLRNATNKPQVVGRDEQTLSSKSPQNLVNDLSTVDMHEVNEFSNEDYLELNDLYGLESSSSSSGNSSLMSLNSDECFDADALLRYLENDNGELEEEHVDCRFSVATSAKPNQVAIRPPHPGSVRSNHSTLNVKDSGPANSIREELQSKPSPSSSTSVLPGGNPSLSGPNGHASTSLASQRSRDIQIHPGSSQSGRSPPGSGSKSRIAKLGKRYWCFGSL